MTTARCASPCAALELEGHKVDVACDGQAALDLLNPGDPPDAVIVDVAMPRLGGIKLCDLICRDSKVPVLVLTASDAPATRASAFQLSP
jgi:two-component system, OmpR family, response regulator VanR